jgi:hypothetical protein
MKIRKESKRLKDISNGDIIYVSKYIYVVVDTLITILPKRNFFIVIDIKSFEKIYLEKKDLPMYIDRLMIEK